MADHVSTDGEVMMNHENDQEFMTNNLTTDGELNTDHANSVQEFMTDHGSADEDLMTNHLCDDEEFITDQERIDEEFASDHENFDEEIVNNDENYNEEIVNNDVNSDEDIVNNHENYDEEIVNDENYDEDIINNDENLDEEIVNNDENFDQEIVNNDENFDQEIVNNDENFDQEIVNNDENFDQEIVNNDENFDQEIVNNDEIYDEEIVSNDENSDEDIVSNHENYDEEIVNDGENYDEENEYVDEIPADGIVEIREEVRLYRLSDVDEWIDAGLGTILIYVDGIQNTTTLDVYANSDGSVVFHDDVVPACDYRKQQHRFIILTQGAHTVLGVNFEEDEGCDDVWEAICQALGRDPSEVEEIEAEMAEQAQAEALERDTTMEFEEMLDLETIVVSTYERDILSQLIDIVNRLVSPQLADKLTTPDESQLLDLCAVSEYLTDTELEQLHEIILYLSIHNQEAQ